MNDEPQVPDSIIDAQMQRLLDIVKTYQQEQCEVLMSEARQQSRGVIRQAYQLARKNIHEDIQATRQHIRDTMAAARAKQHTLMMQQRHTAASSFLEQCWDALQGSLLARWQQPQYRREWAAKILSTAAAVVPAGDWQVEHPEDWSDQEQQQLGEQARALPGVQLQFNSVPGLAAGIRISADGAIVDGSLPGLLADRTAIESLILATAPGIRPRV
jgi:vacuolar-type H+-ATPase subunit H